MLMLTKAVKLSSLLLIIITAYNIFNSSLKTLRHLLRSVASDQRQQYTAIEARSFILKTTIKASGSGRS